ncbi:hypothetical protein LG329_04090 [Virgibacillus necropolis]|uniref:hypothetical protein n=1 Tax=Virgibacillus necropolis TaxID=163877 RepID=UPI00384A9D73
MRKGIGIKPIIFVLVFILLAGCSLKSEKEALKDTEEAAKQTFNSSEDIETNKKLENFSLYLPEDLSVKEATASNVILKNGDQTYIVFYNKLEGPTSKLNYKSAQRDEALLIKSFEDPEKFGYIRVLSSEDDKYELQVGIGGVKITTYTDKSSMDEDGKNLMKIARSIAETDENKEANTD